MSENLPVLQEIPELTKIADLAPEALQRLNNLFRVMTASPEGLDIPVEWRPEALKMRHPISNDPLMPAETEVGDIYANGKLLWSRNDHGRKKPFEFVTCKMWQSRARFVPGDNKPNCSSNDGKWNVYGTMECKNCPDFPFRDGQKTSCQNTLNAVILPLDLSGVYIARFSKSSYRVGSNIATIAATSQHLWDKPFGLITKEQTAGANTYNVFSVAVLDKAVPKEVALFAKYVSASYSAVREEMLEAESRRRDVDVTDALAGGARPALPVDDDGFQDSM